MVDAVAATHLQNALLPLPYLVAKSVALALSAALQVLAAATVAFACAATEWETAAAVFFFIVKPVDMITKRRGSQEPDGEAISDEERRHQELLAALRSRA